MQTNRPALKIPDIVVVDVETTGGSPPSHRVMEVAAVRMRYTEEHRRLSTFVHPGRFVPRRISMLTGITDEMLVGAPLFEDVAEVLWDFMQGAVFCGHNANFDARFLRFEFAQWGAVPPALEEDAPMLCTMKMARRLLPHLKNHKLDTIAAHMNLEFTQRHRALGDTLVTAEIFRRFLLTAYRSGVEDLDGILKLQSAKIPRFRKNPIHM